MQQVLKALVLNIRYDTSTSPTILTPDETPQPVTITWDQTQNLNQSEKIIKYFRLNPEWKPMKSKQEVRVHTDMTYQALQGSSCEGDKPQEQLTAWRYRRHVTVRLCQCADHIL